MTVPAEQLLHTVVERVTSVVYEQELHDGEHAEMK